MPRLLLVICTLTLLTTAAIAAPRQLELPGPDKAALEREDIERDGPMQFAWPAAVTLDATDGAGWDRLSGGEHRWQLEVRAPGSLSLNFGFQQFRLPWGGRLIIAGTEGAERIFTADDNQDSGELWTPVVLGDRALITLVLPARHRDDVALELIHVGRGYRFFGEPRGSSESRAEKIEGCNIDVVCSEGDDWREEIRSVGVFQIEGRWMCSGAMINNTAEDGTPYFLTANHCDIEASNDHTLVVYWNYESPECGMLSGGNLDEFQMGSTWRASNVPSDMTLVELSALPDTTWHVTYAGWDRSGRAVPAAVGIHHPTTDEKCISFEDDPLQITSYLGTTVPGNSTHWRVVDWDLGTTEGGSSGSPLFDPEHRIVGQLHGGYAACGNDLSDWYGRVSVSWSGGDTPSTQLAAWLDAEGTGALVLDTYDPAEPGQPPVEPEPEVLVLSGAVPNPAVGAVARLRVEMPQAGTVKLRVFDLRGRRMGTVYEGELPVGISDLDWEDPSVPAGVYVARLEALGEIQTQTFTLVR